MTKIVQILYVALLAVALCSAEAPRSRTSRLQARRNRLARQEAAADAAAVTPYPTADELRPEVPFDETVTAEEPQPNQPDEVYGPPEDEAPIEADNVTAEEEKTVAEEETVEAEEESAPARLTARRSSSVRRSSARPAKLRKATPARLQLKPKFIPQPVFYYVAH